MKKITNTTKNPNTEWLMGGNPNAIEAQEAQGQKELVESSQLPSTGNVHVKDQYEKMGIKIINESNADDNDDLFLEVQLPAGWEVKATDHPMHSDLIDDKGRKRAGIFYKASFYDRVADITFRPKISYIVDRLAFLNNDYTRENDEYIGYKTPFVGRVYDCSNDNILFETEHIKCDVEYDEGKYYSKKYIEELSKIQNQLTTECLNFLDNNYPDFQNINAYWD